MKNVIKILGLTMLIIILLLQNKVFATGGQASGTTNTVYNKSVSYFFELARAMETASGTLAKASNISMTDYVDSSGNGIDCHLEKNTEYGTITLLAASEFGNATSTNTASTGANNTGVFQMSNNKYEYVANVHRTTSTSGKTSNISNKALINADQRYVDEYTGLTKYSIPGDGIIDTDGWGGYSDFLRGDSPIFQRGYSGFFGYYVRDSAWKGDGRANDTIGCRAVVVCGPGL